METIGAFIKKQREILKKSGRQLAKEADINSGYLSLIERDKKKPSPDILKKIAKPLHLPYEELLAKAGYLPQRKPAEEPEILRIADIAKKLPGRRRREALQILG